MTAKTISFKEMSERHGEGGTSVSPMESEPKPRVKNFTAGRQCDSAGEASDWACSLVVERRICNAEVVGSNPTGSKDF